MYVNSSLFGLPVRPRVLTHAFIYPKELFKNNFDVWWKETSSFFRYRNNIQKHRIINHFNKPIQELFQTLSIGKYCGKIISYIIFHKKQYILIDSPEKSLYYENDIKRRFGNCAKLYPIAIGVKFYESYHLDDNKIVLANPWKYSDENSQWFYWNEHIVSMIDVLKFESLSDGDFVSGVKISGLVTKVLENSKIKNFYNKSSWTNKKIEYLSKNGFKVLKPNMKFNIFKSLRY